MNPILLLFCVAFFSNRINAQDLKSYNNYDFVAGENILFEDDFSTSMKGEFPPRWNLVSGQAVVNETAGRSSLILTEGSYAKVAPAMKKPKYLGSTFTLEFDFYLSDASTSVMVFLVSPDDDARSVTFGVDVYSGGFSGEYKGSYPASTEGFENKWHHAALAFKDGQLKAYVDQYRVLVVPKCGFTPFALQLGGIGSLELPVMFSNVRLAEGGGMNMLSKILQDGKWVTHGITFDVNSAKLKPESMGVLNEIVKAMQSKSDLKLEIGGHTDSDGDDASNLKLSEARAESVKKQLVSMGISGDRLSIKGYGETKPLDTGNSAEAKAKNRRVEFSKK